MESSGYRLRWAPPGEKCGLASGTGVPGLGQNSIDHAVAAGVEDVGGAHYRHLSRFASQEWLLSAEFRISGLYRPDDASVEMHHNLQGCATGFADESTRTPRPWVSLEAIGVESRHDSPLHIRQILAGKTAAKGSRLVNPPFSPGGVTMAPDVFLQRVLASEERSGHYVRGSMCALKGKRQARARPAPSVPARPQNRTH